MLLYFNCIIAVLCDRLCSVSLPFLPWVGLWSVIVAFPGHTHFFWFEDLVHWDSWCVGIWLSSDASSMSK